MPKGRYAKSKRVLKRNPAKANSRQFIGGGLIVENTGLPTPSAPSYREVFNPTWNPQFFKVARTFQLSAPSADVGAGFGKYYDFELTPSATLLAYNSAAYSFSISDVYNVTEFGALFDQYRIAAVKLRFDFISGTEAVVNPASALGQCVTLAVYDDFDDSTAPTASNTGWQAVMETGRVVRKVFPARQNFLEYNLRPKYLTADVDTSATTTGRSLASGWVDGSTGLDVIWRGVKVIGQANPSTATSSAYRFRITATYYLQWRSRQ